MLLDIAGLLSSPRCIDGGVNRKLQTGITLHSTSYDERSHLPMVIVSTNMRHFDLLQHGFRKVTERTYRTYYFNSIIFRIRIVKRL
jgi:hypothetical protein